MLRSLFGGALLASLACGACGAPSSFDGVTGGSKGEPTPAPAPSVAVQPTTTLTQDEDLAAPRQISPISVSLVSTARPRFKWSLAATATGAIVELCQSHDFKKDVKTFQATGGELVVTEDLALGVWFWRIRSTTQKTYSATPSAVWEIVVRGPAAHGSSEVPSRGMVDMNGDGLPDLIEAKSVTDLNDGSPSADAGAPLPTAVLTAHPGSDAEGHIEVHNTVGLVGWGSSYTGPISIGGGTDLDGDGLTDVVEAGGLAYDESGVTKFSASVMYAAPYGSEFLLDGERGTDLYTGPDATKLPLVSAAGDVDGDGYGDAVVGLDNQSFVALGAVAKSFTPLATLPLDFGAPAAPSGRSRAALGAFDANGDGLSDVIFSFTDGPQGGAFVAPGDRGQRVGTPTTLDGALAAPTAFAAGDFNGDGIDDIAFTVASGTSSQVCVTYGDRNKMLKPGACLPAPAGETDFGLSLTAVDLEGDGIDEILATTKASAYGVRAIRAPSSGPMTTSIIPITPGVGIRLTTIWPGRPGKARWAAAAADGTHIQIYVGDTYFDRIYAEVGATGFGRGLR